MEGESKGSSVKDLIKEKIEDWDDEVVATARFKAFSGQKSDWESRYLFWRDLIITIAHQFNFVFVKPSEIRSQWFSRGGLAPLCLDQVLHLMYVNGDIIRQRDMLDIRSGHLSYLFHKLGNLMGTSKRGANDFLGDDYVVLTSVLKHRAAEVVKCISSNHWTSSCIISMTKFHGICGGSDEANVILSYLFGSGKARYLSKKTEELLEGVKVSLSAATVPSITTLDYDNLHLIWTKEKLQQQLDVIDQRYDVSRRLALASLNSGNKKTALKYARELKITTESREKVASLLNRVEEVLNAIADAESTKTVSEAIQIGARAMNDHEISWEELQRTLQQLDRSIDIHKKVSSAIDSAPFCSIVEDENVEEEFKKLELEIVDQNPEVSAPKCWVKNAGAADDSLNDAFSKLDLVECTGSVTENKKSISKKNKTKTLELDMF